VYYGDGVGAVHPITAIPAARGLGVRDDIRVVDDPVMKLIYFHGTAVGQSRFLSRKSVSNPQYAGGTPSFCTITESSLDLIPAANWGQMRNAARDTQQSSGVFII
jgi:hypothetical protein